MGTHAPAEVRRAQILDAALQCLGERGLEATRIDDIGAAAGLSKGAIYFQFASKDEIFQALFERFEQQVFDEWANASIDDPAEALEKAGESALRALLALRPALNAWLEFIRQPPSRARMASVYAGSRARLAAMVERGIERGRLRPIDPHAVAGGLTALVEGLLLQAFVDPEYDPLPVWPVVWAAFWSGLGAMPDARA